MDNADIKKLIDDFIEFIDAGSRQPIALERSLMLLLDSLGLSQAYINFKFDDNDYPDPPDEAENSIRERICNNFQDYGYYNCTEEIEDKIAETDIIVGDADSVTGQSIMEIDSGTTTAPATTAALPIRLVRRSRSVENEAGSFAVWVVRINQHASRDTTGL